MNKKSSTKSLPEFASDAGDFTFANLRPHQVLTYDARAQLMMVHAGRLIPVYVGSPIATLDLTTDLECETMDLTGDLELV